MKIYTCLIIVSSLYIAGCKPGKKEAAKKLVEDTSSIHYEANGFENLNNSADMNDILCQTWDFKEDITETKDLDITSSLDVVYRSYCFFKDGTVVKDPRGYIKTGKWSINEKQKPITITLSFDDGKKESWQLAHLMPYEMILSAGNGTARKTIELSSEALRHLNIKEDPFYVDNIRWRIPPKAPETDVQIKKRFKDYIHFFVLYYDQKIKSQAEKITFIGLPTCFNWYSGGVSLQGEYAVQKKWIDCFYNREQAMKAYKIADKLIRKKYDLPKIEGNWLKANVSILKGIESRIDSIH